MPRRLEDGPFAEPRMNRVVLSAGALLLAAVFVAVESTHMHAWWARERAERLYYDGDFNAALAHYDRVADWRSGEPRSHTDPADSISQYLSGAGQSLPREEFDALTAKAVRHYLRAIDTGPPAAWSFARIAVLADALGRSRSRGAGVDLARLSGDPEALGPEDRLAEVAWARAVELEPRNFYYRDFIGDFYLRRGFVDRAVAHFRYSVRLHPVPDSHYYLSDFATISPVIVNAVEAGVRDALEAEDTFVSEYDIHRFLAALYLKLDRTDDAIASYEAATLVAPVPHAVDVQIGQLLAREGRDVAALKAFRRAVDRAPDYARGWLSLGITLSRTGDHAEAMRALYRARSLAPGDYSTSSALARVLAAAGEIDQAIEILEQVIRKHSDKPLAYMQLIELYEGQGRHTEATRVARRLAARFPEEELYKEQLRQLEERSGAKR